VCRHGYRGENQTGDAAVATIDDSSGNMRVPTIIGVVADSNKEVGSRSLISCDSREEAIAEYFSERSRCGHLTASLACSHMSVDTERLLSQQLCTIASIDCR
jgi:hypothetical protein